MSTLIDEKRVLHSKVSEIPSKPLVFEEAFGEVWLNDEWVKVEVIKREGSSESDYLVERIDGCGPPFEVKVWELDSFGSHDPESKQQIRKREEFQRFEKFLKERDCTIERMEEDGNCLSRAVARKIYGVQEQYQ